ncbi:MULTISPECIES: ABC transporter ATP-binding protein [Peptoniphilus]|uniref:ABC transporter ATP-binding protein n=1 Tax=Peptoniphilus TaxID=162289 RepID=UPI0003B90AC3|nr:MULTISPECIES: ABC transporter ATP-binding protein [Peptoniphilus]ERT63276.1 ABC transporter, ATP-binding protein [Peptoniphilus sp. BV3AC2]MDK8276737.1 ABC transporter ATP-binding protein [Peptoniphilus duerdenii]
MKNLRERKELLIDLLNLVKPLSLQMIFAVSFGLLGHVFATLIPGLGAYYFGKIYIGEIINLKTVLIILITLAILRSLFKYTEQLFNHYVAFKTLAIIRDLVFKSLRRLCPAKMDTKNKGQLISIITADIELLEVFYAHTISPVLIAFFHTLIFFIILYKIHWKYALCLLVFHIVLGIIIPTLTQKIGERLGDDQRKNLSNLNLSILESLKGIKEVINFSMQDERMEEVDSLTRDLNRSSKKLSNNMGNNFATSSTIILIANIVFILVGARLYMAGEVNFLNLIFPIAIFISSFGPTSALASLGNNLVLTFACGKRVMSLLREAPAVDEVTNKNEVSYEKIDLTDVEFSYDDTELIKDFNLSSRLNQVVGLEGKSGCGKSTVLKLIMRFFDPIKGSISLNEINLKDINSRNLRDNISYVAQESHLFKGTIRENLLVANESATEIDLIEATKKANIYDFIMSLDHGFDTEIVKDKALLSTGQIQRLALARMFLRDSKLYILDEPTANIDAYNEGIILKSLYEEKDDKTIFISSHRKSTLRICDKVINMQRSINS